jgi:FkbM family methyltransferase
MFWTARRSLARLLPHNVWTLAFLGEWLPNLTLRSALRLRSYEVRKSRDRISKEALLVLDVVWPMKARVVLREVGSDSATFEEIVKVQVYKVAVNLVPRCETILDLGANIGLASLYLSARYPTCHVFAVEPHPFSYNLLKVNVSDLVASGRCRTLQAAVWDSSVALMPGAVTGEREHYSAYSVQAVAEGNQDQGQIAGLTMRELLDRSGFERCDLLKVDIEGAEVHLFSGDLSWLDRVEAIAIEFHGESRAQSNFDELMRQYRFRIHDHDPHTVVAVKHARD